MPGLGSPYRGELIPATEVLPDGVPVSPLPPPPPASRWRRYKPWIAAVLSFLIPGFGQLYNRDYLRGIVWLIITPGFWIGSAGALGWPFHLISSYTAYQRAQRTAASAASSSQSRGTSFLRRRAAA